MLVVSLGGSPSLVSRSDTVLEHGHRWLQQRGVEVARYRIRDFNAEDLLLARFDSPQIQNLHEQITRADGLLIATPVYKAAYSGALKTVLDLLPERALEHKVVLPIATAGSSTHMLALDYSLKPVLSALKAQEIFSGVFAEDSQIEQVDQAIRLSPALEQRLEEALEQFHQALARRSTKTQ
ncbi:NADPH-dependent FMN reductase [Azomonas macrocytogenes]|uniref:FMN reductase n=1 Tax=Azomonas macrocytogenes TaxID=69962 RepID=A0A839T321_AZOMA|nr:NADPH-dependent FMN reductase [Azomonas macrocytogenes]MBB3102365.1 FMN reductase [Azomonas macrocytogenes]